jgi:thiol:disulfide interchange protein DsbC
MKKVSIAILGMFTILMNVQATESDNELLIRDNLKAILASEPIEKITKTKFGDLYEVLTPRGIVYTDKSGKFVIFNSVIIDTKDKSNLSEQRIAELSKFKFADLPLADAIKTVNGNGKRILATIEDPNCGFCKKLITELTKLPDTTVYTFLTPILGEDSVIKSKAIWCSTDKSASWINWMRDNNQPEATSTCDTPFERNIALSKKLRVNGTPAILFQSGQRIPGYTTADSIEKKLVLN